MRDESKALSQNNRQYIWLVNAKLTNNSEMFDICTNFHMSKVLGKFEFDAYKSIIDIGKVKGIFFNDRFEIIHYYYKDYIFLCLKKVAYLISQEFFILFFIFVTKNWPKLAKEADFIVLFSQIERNWIWIWRQQQPGVASTGTNIYKNGCCLNF